jgi:hypothetical protein
MDGTDNCANENIAGIMGTAKRGGLIIERIQIYTIRSGWNNNRFYRGYI